MNDENNKKKPSITPKEKIVEAVKKMLEYNNYDYVTIRNICKAANISNGTFYHYFNSKDDLTTYIITEGYLKYKVDRLSIQMNYTSRVVDVFIYMAAYLSSFGLGFMSNYLSVKNMALNVDSLLKSDEHNEIVDYVLYQITLAQDTGMFMAKYNPREIYDELNVIFYGSLFYWCLYQGNYDLLNLMEKSLNSIFNRYLKAEFQLLS